MRRLACLALPAILATHMAAVAAPDAPRTSWGKAGVPLALYREEAVMCGRAGIGTDVSQTEAAKTLVRASTQIDRILDTPMSGAPALGSDGQIDPAALNRAQQVQQITEGARPRAQFRAVRATLQDTVDTCLTEHGYVQFVLTRDQRERLGKLKRGTPERHAYLHALASDPDVLARQRPQVTVLEGEAARQDAAVSRR